MTELTIVNPQLRRLFGRFQSKWRTLAEQSAMLFIVGGGLLLVTSALFAVQALTPVSTEGVLTGVTGFLGIILSYIGLLGLYPWFATRTPQLARASFVLVALPTIIVVVLLVWGVATHLPVGAVPSPVNVVPEIGSILVATFLLFAVGISLFGLASLQSGFPSGTAGVLLMGLAATWAVLLVASSVYGSKFPAWLDALTFGAMGIALSGIGHSLRTGAPIDPPTEQATDSRK